MIEYRVKRQKIIERLDSDTRKMVSGSKIETFNFQDLDDAKRAFCDYVLAGYEWVFIERDYNSGICGGIAIYNKRMDEYT